MVLIIVVFLVVDVKVVHMSRFVTPVVVVLEYRTGFKYIEKITATAPQPHRTVFRYFAIFKNVAHSLKPGERPSISASHQASNYVQRS